MAQERIDLRKKLQEHKFEFGLLQKIPCSKEENKSYQELLKNGGTLPEGVYAYVYDSGETSTSEFFTVYQLDLTDAQIQEYLTYKQLSMIKTIKNCVVFFTVLTVIGMILAFFIALGAF